MFRFNDFRTHIIEKKGGGKKSEIVFYGGGGVFFVSSDALRNPKDPKAVVVSLGNVRTA